MDGSGEQGMQTVMPSPGSMRAPRRTSGNIQLADKTYSGSG